jgi:calcineurin-like phosphoesterase
MIAVRLRETISHLCQRRIRLRLDQIQNEVAMDIDLVGADIATHLSGLSSKIFTDTQNFILLEGNI